MTYYALTLLALAALIGFTMVYIGVRYRHGTVKLAMAHAFFAVAGLGVLGAQIYQGEMDKYNNLAALLLLLALIGGGLLFALREKDQPPPMVMVFFHAIMALSGLGVMVLGLR